MNELLDKIGYIRETQARYDALDSARKECGKELDILKDELCQTFRDSMLGKTVIGDYEVTAKFEPHYSITGGKFKAPENAAEVIGLLVDLGYLDDSKVARYQATEVPDNSLQAAFRKLDTEHLLDLKEKGLISIFDKPKVSIKEKK